MGVDPLGFMLYIRSQEQEEITVSARIHSEVARAPSPTRSPTPEHPWCFLGGPVQINSSRGGTDSGRRSFAPTPRVRTARRPDGRGRPPSSSLTGPPTHLGPGAHPGHAFWPSPRTETQRWMFSLHFSLFFIKIISFQKREKTIMRI